ncbi:MAG: exo-alpha-sialidase [Phycisphaerales bacterium]|nr:exo-alpha-sialidase [Phycisphaerales bacterium]
MNSNGGGLSVRAIAALALLASAVLATGRALAASDAPAGNADALVPATPAPPDSDRPPHYETPDMPFVPAPLRPGDVRGRTTVREGRYVSVQVNVDANGNNIPGDAANEPSLAIDPVDPSKLVIGWRQFDTVTSNFRQAGWAYSHDAGRTWTFPGKLEPGVFRSDPVLDTGVDGTVFYYSLSSDFSCQMFRSIDHGQTWLRPVFGLGGDKQWFAIDMTTGIGRGNIYASWSTFGSPTGGATFTRSTDGGRSFEGPFTLPSVANWGTLAVGPDGTVYQVGTTGPGGGFNVLRSTNAKTPGVWPTFTTTSVNLGGVVVFSEPPNPAGLLGQSWIAVNHAPGPLFNQVYVLSTIKGSGQDPMDITFIRSVNGGTVWSQPLVINDDPAGNWQWFGTLSVAPNGRLDAVWIDSRNSGGQAFIGQIFYSNSLDGGLTWSPNVALTPAFDASLGYPQQNKMGDYFDMHSDNAGASLAYAATFNGEQDIYFIRIGLYDCNQNGVDDDQDILLGTSGDCNANRVPDECEPGGTSDCNLNGLPDRCDIDAGVSQDCNRNHVPDECELFAGTSQDCNNNGVPDECELGGLSDCNQNGIRDLCETASGTTPDCDGNGIPDSCERDCNNNGIPDPCEVLLGLAPDCNGNLVPDACELGSVVYDFPLDADPGWPRDAQWAYGQPTGGGTTGRRDPTSGFTGPNVLGYNLAGLYANNLTPRRYLTAGPFNLYGRTGTTLRFRRWLGVQAAPADRATIEVSADKVNWSLVWQNVATTISESAWSLQTYDISGVADGQVAVWIRWGMGPTDATQQYQGWNIDDIRIEALPLGTDCNSNGILDSCEPGGTNDCDGDGIPDFCELLAGSPDCNFNGVPDSCEPGGGTDCNVNGITDWCEIANGTQQDCNHNGQLDICDLAAGIDTDCNGNGVLDSCDLAAGAPDCNANGVLDSCDIAAYVSQDCNGNGIPDECDLAVGASPDCNSNGVPDECDVIAAPFVATSGHLAPLGTGFPQQLVLPQAPDAAGSVTIQLIALGDLNSSDENVTVLVNSTAVGVAYAGGGFVDCIDGQTDSVVVSAASFNAAKSGPSATITLLASPGVSPNPTNCPDATYIRVRLAYTALPRSEDLNGNQVPDECEQPAICRGDCDCDGNVDFDDIDYLVAALGGEAAWRDFYATQHAGQQPPCSYASCDVDASGGVTFDDIDPFVAAIGTACP